MSHSLTSVLSLCSKQEQEPQANHAGLRLSNKADYETIQKITNKQAVGLEIQEITKTLMIAKKKRKNATAAKVEVIMSEWEANRYTV